MTTTHSIDKFTSGGAVTTTQSVDGVSDARLRRD